MRAWLFALDEGEYVLVVLVHHIAGDGWSVGVLVRDLARPTRRGWPGQAPGWAPLPVQYADYALWQRELLGDDAGRPGQRAGGAAGVLAVGAGRAARGAGAAVGPAPPARCPVTGAARCRWTLDAELHARLAGLAREHQATLFMVVQAGAGGAAVPVGAGTDIPLGAPVAGRGDEALHDLVGFFVNTLVLRTDVSGDPSFAELLARVREADLAAYANQDVPFERLVEVLNPAARPARHPLFQVMLVVRGRCRQPAPGRCPG